MKQLHSALFGALLAAVATVAGADVTKFAGTSGAYALALIAGIADVDAISLTMASHGVGEIGIGAAALSVLLAILSNTIVKAAISWVVGGFGMGWRFSAVSILALGAGLAALAFFPALPSL